MAFLWETLLTAHLERHNPTTIQKNRTLQEPVRYAQKENSIHFLGANCQLGPRESVFTVKMAVPYV